MSLPGYYLTLQGLLLTWIKYLLIRRLMVERIIEGSNDVIASLDHFLLATLQHQFIVCFTNHHYKSIIISYDLTLFSALICSYMPSTPQTDKFSRQMNLFSKASFS